MHIEYRESRDSLGISCKHKEDRKGKQKERGQTHTILQVASCRHELDGMGSSCWSRSSRAGGAQLERRERESEGEGESKSKSMRERARAKSKRERYRERARQREK